MYRQSDRMINTFSWSVLFSTILLATTFASKDAVPKARYANTSWKALKLVREWSQLDWIYPSHSDRQNAIYRGDFLPGKPVPIDMDVHYAGHDGTRIFITVPRFQEGVPAALNTVEHDGRLKPYPSWSWHLDPSQCKSNRIVSVYRVMIDECQRLWVLDTGVVDVNQVCSPQLLSFDLKTNQLISKYEFPANQITSNITLLVTPVVDVRDPIGQCTDTFVYIADVTTFGMIVYDARRRSSWRVNSNLFFPNPEHGYFKIAGQSFDLMDGLIGMALSPYKPSQDRLLFFHSLASTTENRIATSILRNSTLFQSSADAAQRQFYVYDGDRPSQAAAEAIDKNGIAFFGLMGETAIGCWNTRAPFGGRNIDTVARDHDRLQFAAGVKVITNAKGTQELWVITNRFQKFMTDTLTTKDTNFRILAAKIEDLVRGGKCTGPSGGYGLYKPPWGSYSFGF